MTSTPENGADATDPGTAELSYEQARQALGEVVQRLEAGGTTLEESIALWERGEQLAGICQRLLDGAQQRLDDVIARTEAGHDHPSAQLDR